MFAGSARSAASLRVLLLLNRLHNMFKRRRARASSVALRAEPGVTYETYFLDRAFDYITFLTELSGEWLVL